jgi:outer membrane protein
MDLCGGDVDLGTTLQQEQGSIDLATLDTVTLLPVFVEFRPGRFGNIQPYIGTGIGVNINSMSTSQPANDAGFDYSPSNSFAWRVAGGLDYPMTQHLLLNTEFAVNRNRMSIGEAPGADKFPTDATSMNILFGVKYTF